jgi:hypothetical protein
LPKCHFPPTGLFIHRKWGPTAGANGTFSADFGLPGGVILAERNRAELAHRTTDWLNYCCLSRAAALRFAARWDDGTAAQARFQIGRIGHVPQLDRRSSFWLPRLLRIGEFRSLYRRRLDRPSASRLQ